MKKLLLLALATLCSAHAQLMNPASTITRSDLFKGYQQTSPGTFKKGFATLKLTEKAGVVVRADLSSNTLSLADAAETIAFLTGYGDTFTGPVLNFLKQNQKELAGGISVLDEDSQYTIGVMQKDALIALSVERYQFPEGTFPKEVPTYGKKDARVAIRILSDYQCPYCQRLAQTVLPQWKEQSQKMGFKIEHHQFPLSYHANAFVAAEASECAESQGKFWEFTDAIFKDWDWTRKSTPDAGKHFAEVARSLKMDPQKFNTCMSTHQFKDRVEAGLVTGQKARLGGTPSVYVGNYKVGNWNNWSEIQLLIKLSQ